MQKCIILLLLLFNICFAGLEVGITHVNNNTCNAKIKNYSSINNAGDYVNIKFFSNNQPVIFNNCQFVVIDKQRKNVIIKGGRVASVIGCDNNGRDCTISFKNEKSTSANINKKPQPTIQPNKQEYIVSNKIINKSKGEIIIAIDAGHGGQDPGAVTKSGVREKDITLRYAKHIAANLKKGGYKVFLTRTGDETIKLYERIDMAMIHNADFFISIHADSAVNKNARGATIYTLSPQSINNATISAENRLNIGGNFIENNESNKDEDLIFNILNLQHSSNLRQSFDFAESLVLNMKKKEIRFTSVPIRPANFAVLKAPLFPAILLELGYLSNTDDERMLQDREYMERISTSIKVTLDEFLKANKT